MIQELFAGLARDWRDLTSSIAPAPTLALALGQLELNQRTLDRSSRPQTRDVQERIVLRPGTTDYPLSHTPMAGTLRCDGILDPEGLSERRLSLASGVDYTVDLAAPALRLTAGGAGRLAQPAHLLAAYRYVGVVANQEFLQQFSAAVGAPSWLEVERWTSILLALLVTDHDALVERYNRAMAVTPYAAGSYASRQMLEQITVLNVAPTGDTPAMSLHCAARGRFELSKTAPPSFGLIEQVISPGRGAGGQALDIAIGVEQT